MGPLSEHAQPFKPSCFKAGKDSREPVFPPGNPFAAASVRLMKRLVLVAVLVLAATGFVVMESKSGEPACKTRVVLESIGGGDRIVFDTADQHGNDVVRDVYLSDRPLPKKFAWAEPVAGARMAMLFVWSKKKPLSEGARLRLGASSGRRGFAPAMLGDDRLKGTIGRPGSGSLTVVSVHDGLTCLRVDYKNEVATLKGTVALVVTGDDEKRGF